jgi:hypothetical protein
MIAKRFDRPEPAPLAVNCPGGMACQYRVQYFDGASESRWKLHASFRDPHHAQQCLDELQSRGITARLIAYRALPTAA